MHGLLFDFIILNDPVYVAHGIGTSEYDRLIVCYRAHLSVQRTNLFCDLHMWQMKKKTFENSTRSR